MVRSGLKHGDIILFRGKSLVSRLIFAVDSSYYSHTGIVFRSQDRLFIIDSNKHGVSPKFLSTVMGESVDFCVVRPQAWTESCVQKALNATIDAAEKSISYDFGSIAQIFLYRKMHIRCSIDNDSRDTCSEFVRRYVRHLDHPQSFCYEQPHLPTNFISPWDFVLYADASFEVLYDACRRADWRKS